MSGFTSGNQTSLSADDETDTGDGDDCGNGQVDPGEECDLGPDNSPEGQCTPDCTITECGDGYHNPTYDECAYTTMSACRLSASGRPAECFVDPFFGQRWAPAAPRPRHRAR